MPKRKIILGVTKKMKRQPKIDFDNLKKVRSKINAADVYLTSTQWETKEVDGVTFIPVVVQMPNGTISHRILWMRKDNMEYVR